MEVSRTSVLVLFLFVLCAERAKAAGTYSVYCSNSYSRCYGKYIKCPAQCPSTESNDPKAKVCYVNCDSPVCTAQCRYRKPNCNSPGSACYDPRFIGGDGVVFYFHGKSNEHFSLVSDTDLQINARFIGHRPSGRTRDFTWIQALGVLTHNHSFSLEATKATAWDSDSDHLRFTFDGEEVSVPEETLALWYSPQKDFKIERVAKKNSVIVTIIEKAEILINVVPVTREDDRVHGYRIPENDCFAHLEAQFRFFSLTPEVEGVLGRTYRPDFVNPAKPGVAMPVIGGDEEYRTSSLTTADCANCGLFSTATPMTRESKQAKEYPPVDCTQSSLAGYGIVCRK